MLTYSAGGLKVGLVFIYIHTLCVRAGKALVKFKKMRRLIGFVALATCTDAYIRVDKLYKVKHASSLFGPVGDT